MWKKVAFLGLFTAVFGGMTVGMAAQSPPTCANAAVRLTHDYAYARGSADFFDPDGDVESGSAFRWLVNGVPTAAEEVAEHLLLHLDDSLDGCGGETANLAQGVSYASGKWGSALMLESDGRLRFEREGNLGLTEGTIEMWVAMRADGDDPVFSSRWHVLFTYRAPDGDTLHIAQAGDTGILYAGGVVDGEWQSAYGYLASTRAWQAGEWHHLAFTYSDAQDFMRFYVDGALTADTNEGHYWPPSAGGADYYLGGEWWGNAAYYLVDEVRVSGRVATSEEIAARARRLEQPRCNEVWLDTDSLDTGDSVVFEFTPSTASETGLPCQSAPLLTPGIPITDPQPPSTLLPPATTQFTLSVQSIENTTCAYAVGDLVPYDGMTPFDQGAGNHRHHAATQVDHPALAVRMHAVGQQNHIAIMDRINPEHRAGETGVPERRAGLEQVPAGR